MNTKGASMVTRCSDLPTSSRWNAHSEYHVTRRHYNNQTIRTILLAKCLTYSNVLHTNIPTETPSSVVLTRHTTKSILGTSCSTTMSDSSSHIQTVQSDSPITAADTLPLPRTPDWPVALHIFLPFVRNYEVSGPGTRIAVVLNLPKCPVPV